MAISKSASGFSGVTRVMVFIDGGYLRKQLKDMFGDDSLNYGALINSLRVSCFYGPLYPQLIRAYYYDAESVGDEAEELKKQANYFDRVIDNDFVELRTGRLKRTGQGIHRQKGVDTLIAIDILAKAYENHYDVAVLLAGDDDFLDVVKAVKNAGKQIYGAYFIGHVSDSLSKEFDRRLFLKKEALEQMRKVSE